MEGTREDVFKEVYQWLDDPTADRNILWIKGNPGAGKSAMASSLVSQLTQAGRLGGSFFFRQDDASSSDPIALWRTVAYELAHFNTDIASTILQNLKDRRADPKRPDIQDHFNALIKAPIVDSEPYFTMQQGRRHPVIVIDALDECGNKSQYPQRKALIDTLIQWSKLSKALKLIITSRDERVPESLRQTCQVVVLPTGDQVTAAALADVRTFFVNRFDQLKMDFPSLEATDWPGLSAIEKLTTRAAGLFIWAETVMRFIEQGFPEEQLESILSGDSMIVRDHINGLYRQLVTHALGSLQMNEASKAVFQPLLGAIIFSKTPLPRKHLKHFILLSVKESAIDLVLERLKSVISTGDDGLVRIGHLSFAEFLLQSELCPDPLRIDPSTRGSKNLDLLRACLKIMHDPDHGLKFNICGLETSYIRNRDVKDMFERIRKHIGLHLIYACRFWPDHLMDALECIPGCDWILSLLATLFNTHFLHWLEVISLVYDTSIASVLLRSVTPHLRVVSVDLEKFAQDARLFIVNFNDPISQSLPHIYLSALPFAPRESLVSRIYLPRFHKLLSVAGKERNGRHTGAVRSVAFSPDGRLVASGSNDYTVGIWDISTGQMIMSHLRGHTNMVNTVAFSPDGKRLASGSHDKSLRIWDVANGDMVVGPLFSHMEGITSVAFSPDGKLVASGSDDYTIRVWNATSAQMVMLPLQHRQSITSVVFSPNGKLLASSCFNGTVTIWDATTGQIAIQPDTQHLSSINSIAFSPDGKWIASGSSDKIIRIYDVSSGQLVAGPFQGHTMWISSISFSPDGRQLASGSRDQTVRIWDVASGRMIGSPFQGHSAWVSSVAFSPDGKQVVSGSGDNTMRVWDVMTVGETAKSTAQKHYKWVNSIAFSPDGKHLASASGDQTIRIWDKVTGQIVRGPLQGHTKQVSSVAYSPNGKLLASGSHDETIRIWDITSGQMVAGPIQAHTARINCVTFSPDGKIIASSSGDQAIKIWDVVTVQLVADPFQGHTDEVNNISFSPDGKQLASSSNDKTIMIWDVASGQMVGGPFRGHSQLVSSVSFSPNGKQLASCSGDKSIKVWDVVTGVIVLIVRPYNQVESPSSSGWVSFAVSPEFPFDQNLLYWVPLVHRQNWCDFRTRRLIGAPETRISYDRFVHGSNWMTCQG
ncbi:hypothetical protein SERLA73DRAFT_126428 [Serpula lacrymans var. lacrymans S7.3]|uniref:Uncharacterized protein n=1 Tax=Serpula lacrymans var. lacrymans (strain S7.3) TaxID=936435 RepID=F8QD55_SERL3|nr:hypothetical protein SERLA73DRAFT_126428 [Serpula lacrymans var. lacrymans S7.3]